jgi:hypothetical protein
MPYATSNTPPPAAHLPANVGKATATTPPVHPPRIEAPAAAASAAVAAPVVSSAGNGEWVGLFLLLMILACAIISSLCFYSAHLLAERERAKRGAVAGSTAQPAARAATAPVQATIASMPTAVQSNLPRQDGWAARAGRVRDPVSGFLFGIQARANAKALDEDQRRVKSVRAAVKEYTGMFKDLLEGQEAALAYNVRHDLAGELYEHERVKQQDAFDETAHRRRLSEKRRKKELTEFETRLIEAQHEQEALERFKETKFQAGLARFEEKVKGYLVGAASADAAIAETKAPAKPETSANESEEVVKLYALLQSTMAAIEEGERLGRDTQALRQRAELYKKLLNLA